MPGPCRRSVVGGLFAVLGRFLLVSACTFTGLVVGVGYELQRAALLASPPSRATLGMESSGLVDALALMMDLLIGAAGGTLLGLLVGIVAMVAGDGRGAEGRHRRPVARVEHLGVPGRIRRIAPDWWVGGAAFGSLRCASGMTRAGRGLG